MKKNLTTLFFLLMAALAYAVEIPVGYPKGIVASSSAYVVNGKGAVSAATKILTRQTESITICRVCRLRIPRTVSSSRMVRKSL